MLLILICIFFFNDTATTEIYTLSLHDALPIYGRSHLSSAALMNWSMITCAPLAKSPNCASHSTSRSEEHTSELQSRQYLVCRLLLEKKKRESHAHILIRKV